MIQNIIVEMLRLAKNIGISVSGLRDFGNFAKTRKPLSNLLVADREVTKR